MMTRQNTETLRALARALRDAQNPVVACHISPDGDTLGCGLALAGALAGRKQVRVVCDDPVPALYAFLPGARQVTRPETLDFAPDFVLCVDCADVARLGGAARWLQGTTPIGNIDHHGSNPGYGELSVVDADASATGELVLTLLDEMGLPLTRESALCLYTAISTDTGNFSFANTTPGALRAAARCVEAGVDVADAARKLFRLRSFQRAQLHAQAMRKAQLLQNGRVGLIVLTKSDFEETRAAESDSEGVVNALLDIEGVEIAIFAREGSRGAQISLRGLPPVDLSAVAAGLGGGGHARAAGVTLALPVQEAAARVVETVKRQMSRDSFL